MVWFYRLFTVSDSESLVFAMESENYIMSEGALSDTMHQAMWAFTISQRQLSRLIWIGQEMDFFKLRLL
jgi:hypothetical protein